MVILFYDEGQGATLNSGGQIIEGLWLFQDLFGTPYTNGQNWNYVNGGSAGEHGLNGHIVTAPTGAC
jgi:hypothetical protein